jgi:stage II sporulation protein D
VTHEGLRALGLATVLLAAAPAWQDGPAVVAQTPGAAEIRVGVLRNGSYEISTLPLDPYVARVLGGEAAPGTHPSALEALAIAVRTYAVANRNRHRADGFDVCDQTHCQVLRAANTATERASQATAGQILLDRGRPATIYYSASCGGRSEVPSAVWPGSADPSFLPSRKDDACRGEPQWAMDLTAAEIERALAPAGFHGRLKNVRVSARSKSRRVATLRLDGLTPRSISGQDFRMAVGRAFGPLVIRSTAFELRRTREGYRFAGHGYGHGVGMCVIGSMQLAHDGRSAAQILNRYFPGLRIGPVR